MKRIIPLLTALSVITAFSAVPVSAEVYVDSNGAMSSVSKIRMDGIMIETDGTALTEEMVSGIEGYISIEAYDRFVENYGWGYIKKSTITPEGTAYMIRTENMGDDAFRTIGRELMFELDCITDAQLIECWSYQDITDFPSGLSVTLTDAAIVLDAENIPELENFEVTQNDDSVYANMESTEEHVDWIESQDMSDYEKYVYFSGLADTLEETYPDIFTKVSYCYGVLDFVSVSEFHGESIWQSAGDPNADGAVTAEDAADLLITAAEIGTGASIKATSAEDVNADGTVGADDAAAVLCYAAAQGSGNPLSWIDILRK